jgi:formiminotetrahydrofolate cyclodeaminase
LYNMTEAWQPTVPCAALMDADGVSYGSVMAAYRLPKDTEELRTARSAAIATPDSGP